MQNIKDNIVILDNSYKIRESANKINLYDKLHNKVLENLIYLEDHEPLKIFRNIHLKWKMTILSLNNLENRLINEKGREYKNLEEIMSLVSRQI